MTATDIQVPSRKVLGLKYRVRCFFRDNPQEELTHSLLRSKFGCTVATSKWLVSTLVEEGLVESVHVIRLRTMGIAKEEESHGV
jgi:hypothetical protein